MLRARRVICWPWEEGRATLGPGSLVVVHVDDRRLGGAPAPGHRFRRMMVESLALPCECRAARDYGVAHLRALDSGARFTVSTFWVEPIEGA